MLRSVLSLSMALSIPAIAQGTYLYIYTGNNYTDLHNQTPPDGAYTDEMRVTGWFEVENPLPPDLPHSPVSLLNWSLSDGRNSISAGPDQSFFLSISTDSQANVLSWEFNATTGNPIEFAEQGWGIATISYRFSEDVGGIIECATAAGCGGTGGSGGLMQDLGISVEPGTWTFVPEPSTALLLGLGLIGIAAHRRRVMRG